MLRNRPEILMLLSLIKLPTDSTPGPGSIIFQIEYPERPVPLNSGIYLNSPMELATLFTTPFLKKGELVSAKALSGLRRSWSPIP